jgi:hypothetical protein
MKAPILYSPMMGMGASLSVFAETPAVVIEDYFFESTTAYEITPLATGGVSDFHDSWDLDGTDYTPEVSPDDEGYWDDFSNVITNGDFADLGAELVTNRDFSDGTTGWTVNASATGYISTSSQTLQYLVGHGDYAEVKQLNNSIVGKTYTGSFEIISKGTNADVFIQYGRTLIYSGSIDNISIGTHTFSVVPVHTDGFGISVRTNGIIEIDNVSVKQVDPNDRWTLATGWSIEDGKLISSSTSTWGPYTSDGSADVGTTYEVKFSIVDYTSGTVVVRCGGAQSSGFSALGDYEVILTASVASNAFAQFKSSSSFTGSIDNVTVTEYAITPLDV